jgi:hypothetical protein
VEAAVSAVEVTLREFRIGRGNLTLALGEDVHVREASAEVHVDDRVWKLDTSLQACVLADLLDGQLVHEIYVMASVPKGGHSFNVLEFGPPLLRWSGAPYDGPWNHAAFCDHVERAMRARLRPGTMVGMDSPASDPEHWGGIVFNPDTRPAFEIDAGGEKAPRGGW